VLDDGLGDAKMSALRKSADLLMDLESHELGDINVCKVPRTARCWGQVKVTSRMEFLRW
jgi:hypothetical protein